MLIKTVRFLPILWILLFLATTSAFARPDKSDVRSTASQDQSNIPDWVRLARVGGFDSDPLMSGQEVDDLITLRKQEKVSVLEVDSGLSNYMDSTKFTEQLTFLTSVATKAHAEGMKAVIYYPSLEVTTPKGDQSCTNPVPNTMYIDHPEWIQKGINGDDNVFYGSHEVWVEPCMESAWMSPNTDYRTYFINRVVQLAGSGLDGVWVDVPIYLGTGAAWSGAEPAAKTAFNTWSIAQGLGLPAGYETPTTVDWDDPVFRAWIRWRHENLADFVESIRAAAFAANPNFMVIIENFPTDYMDASEAGLDGTFRRSNQNLLRVWEIDSVSNTKAMQWASIDEFSNKFTMYKWARAVDRENPSWGFSYGGEPMDAGLTMAAAITTGVAPFESKTPDMTLTVDSAFRTRWFSFVEDHEQALLGTPRSANVGVWYSSASRDFQDYKIGGGYGMYVTTVDPVLPNPPGDPDWWATDPGDTPLSKPHLGGYRGAAHALIKLHIPFKVIADPGSPSSELDTIKFLWLPSVAAISDQSAAFIKTFVQNGGVVFATGKQPGTHDELGNIRTESVFKDLFNLAGETESINFYGSGVAIYNPTVKGAEMFASVGDPIKARKHLSAVQQLVRIHVPDDLIVTAPDGVHVEIGKPSATKHHLYVTNYSGLQIPIVSSLQDITIDYRVPDGYQVTAATVETPDAAGQAGPLTVSQSAKHYYQMTLNVDQFSLITLTLAEKTSTPTPWPTPIWSTTDHQEVAESGLNFILNKMRHSDALEPMKFGIYTNLIDDGGQEEIYAYGHHVTGEHMGLMLRASACMRNETAYNQSFRFVDEIMADPLYQVVNWAIDRDRYKPLVDLDGVWKNANAPLDDFRVVRGLLAGGGFASPQNKQQLAERLLTGLYWTSLTDRDFKTTLEFPAYPDGLVGYAWDWSGTTDALLTPPAKASGIGVLSTDPIPTDYNDLYMLGQAARLHPLWIPVLKSSTDLLLDSEISGALGLFYNGYQANGDWTGDFENRDANQGKHLKVIQTLWIALHLAAASEFEVEILDEARRSSAHTAAVNSLTFFKNHYQTNSKIPEYLTFSGGEVPACTGSNTPDGCLKPGEENRLNGEARIYALLARLALLLSDPDFAATLIQDKILTDWIGDMNDPRYGLIGASTTEDDDAEAWNVLESVLTLCLEATWTGTPGNQRPVAENQSVATNSNTPLDITLVATDPEDDPLTYSIVTDPAHGQLTGTGATWTYTPNTNYYGSDSFTFKANDGHSNSNRATVSITVNNQPPVADNQSVTTNSNTPFDITLSASDPESDSLSYSIVTLPTHGQLSGTGATQTYTPNTNYFGSDSFTFKANDGTSDSNQATVSITVNNQPPVADVQTVTTNSNTALNIILSATDPEGKSLTYSVVDTPAHGQLSGSAPDLTYTPTTYYYGSDNFTFKANDGHSDSQSATVSITVLNQPPEAESQSVTTYRNTEVDITLSASDPEEDTLRYFAGVPAKGTLTGEAPNLTYTPNSGVSGNDTFTFKAFDNHSLSNEATVTITISNRPPIANNQEVITEQGIEVDMTLNASDPDGDTLSYKVTSSPSYGTLSGNAPNLSYMPNPGHLGKDSFTFKANDGKLDSNNATVTITVTSVSINQPPEAHDQTVTTKQGSQVAITLTASDPEGEQLTYSTITEPSHGHLSGTELNLAYKPNSDYSGKDSFTFKANDGNSDSNSATVSIVVTPPATTYTVTPAPTNPELGSFDPDKPQSVPAGETTSFDITPASRFEIREVSGCGAGTLNGNQYTTGTINQNCTVSALFQSCDKGKVTLNPINYKDKDIVLEESENSLHTKGALVVQSGAKVDYRATTAVGLNPGLRVHTGGELSLNIEPIHCLPD